MSTRRNLPRPSTGQQRPVLLLRGAHPGRRGTGLLDDGSPRLYRLVYHLDCAWAMERDSASASAHGTVR